MPRTSTIRALAKIFKLTGSIQSVENIKNEMCVPMPTHCTIMHFGFHARRIDGVECGLFSNHALLGQTTLRVGRVSVIVYWRKVRMTVCVTVCVV